MTEPWRVDFPVLRKGDRIGWVDARGQLHVERVAEDVKDFANIALEPSPLDRYASMMAGVIDCVAAIAPGAFEAEDAEDEASAGTVELPTTEGGESV